MYKLLHSLVIRNAVRVAKNARGALGRETKTMKSSCSGGEGLNKLGAYLSPWGALSLSIGTSIGWGSFVITSNTYLSQAGPFGSVAGMIVGMLIMLIISVNYHYMMNAYPDAGGVYTYTSRVFDHDYGFLTAWFLCLTYIAIFWANATSLPLFARYFFGGIFKFGPRYTLFGYEVFLGEAMLSVAAMLLAGLVCMKRKRLSVGIVTAMVFAFIACISICFVAVMIKKDGGIHSFEPVMIPGKNSMKQIIRIATISPWAFIGFENISHSTEEFSFSKRRSLRILTASVIITTLLYVFVILLSVTAFPPQYGNWLEYIRDLDNIQGLEGLPAFYAANRYMGGLGVFLLVISLFSLIVTSLIGNLVALSRLFYAISKDKVLSEKYASISEHDTPQKAIWLVLILSVFIPFLGRSAIGWIVDVTTIGATIVYGFVSGTAFKLAKQEGHKPVLLAGAAGIVVMIVFLMLLLFPNIALSDTMSTESYFLFAVWGIFGFIFFRRVLADDNKRRFGKSLVVWIALLLLIIFSSLTYLGQYMRNSSLETINAVKDHYSQQAVDEHGSENDGEYLDAAVKRINDISSVSIIAVMGMLSFAMCVMMSNYSIMSKRETEREREIGIARHMANTDPLTGVKNKNAFLEMENSIDIRINNGTISNFAVCICDLNGLKVINDTLGHKAGDEYLCAASEQICNHFKRSPVFRIGGDEFAVVLEGYDYIHRNEILDSLNKMSEANINNGCVVVAVGISDYIAGKDSKISEVFERADALMYERKSQLKQMA